MLKTHILVLLKTSQSCICTSAVIKLTQGGDNWIAELAVLNQWWVAMYGYWSASIITNIISQEEDNC